MATVIESLLIGLGFQVDDKSLKSFEQNVKDSVKSVGVLAMAVGGAAAAIGGFVATVASGLDDLGDWAEQEQFNVEALQELGYAAQLSGSSMEAVKSSVEGLNKSLGEAALGVGRSAMTFKKLHMSAKEVDGSVKSVDTILGEVADKMQELSRQESIALAEKLGIDRSLVPLLMKGSAEIAKLREESVAFGIQTEEQIATAGAFQDSMDRTRFMLLSLTKTVAVGLMPAVQGALDGFRKWVLANKEIIKANIQKALEVVVFLIGKTWTITKYLVEKLMDLVHWVKSSTVAMAGLYTVLALFVALKTGNAIMGVVSSIRTLSSALAPLIASIGWLPMLIGAIAIGIGLIIEDFMVWKQGGESVIGDLIKKFPFLLDIINSVSDAVGDVVDFFIEQWGELKGPVMLLGESLWELIKLLATHLWPAIKLVGKAFVLYLHMAIPVIKAIIEATIWMVKEIVLGVTMIVDAYMWMVTTGEKVFIAFADAVIGAWRKVSDFVTGVIDKMKDGVGFVSDKLGLSDADVNATMVHSLSTRVAPSNITAPGGIHGRAANMNTATNVVTSNVQNHMPITIVTPDPAKAGESVRKEFDKTNKQVIRNGLSGVTG